MSTRDTTNSATTPKPDGPDFLDEYAGHIGALYDASCLPLTSVAGTGDVVTASVDPALPGAGLKDGMKFSITWAAVNTGGVTLNIDSEGAIPVLSSDGSALVAGALEDGLRDLLEYVGGNFIRLSGGAGGASTTYSRIEYLADGTWTKPLGLDDNRLVLVELWGGGGGGYGGVQISGAGGGGGAYRWKLFRLGDLASSIAVTIGQGGAPGNNGGSTTFGTLLTAYGGESGGETSGGVGAGLGESGAAGGWPGGGTGNGGDASNDGAGGAGGNQGDDGGRSINGGGGGGGYEYGVSSGNGGGSIDGGNGGDANSAGSVPGGGGGFKASGGNGKAIITLL